jgi:arylsulfatase B
VDSLDVWPLLSGANVTSPRLTWPVSEKVVIAFEQPPGSPSVTAGWKLVAGKLDSGAGWAGPVYPNASSPDSDPFNVGLDCSGGPSGACLFDVVTDPTEHVDVAAAHPAKVTQLTAALAAYAQSFYSNADVLTPACPPGTPGDCACWTAANVFGGYLGPWAH